MKKLMLGSLLLFFSGNVSSLPIIALTEGGDISSLLSYQGFGITGSGRIKTLDSEMSIDRDSLPADSSARVSENGESDNPSAPAVKIGSSDGNQIIIFDTNSSAGLVSVLGDSRAVLVEENALYDSVTSAVSSWLIAAGQKISLGDAFSLADVPFIKFQDSFYAEISGLQNAAMNIALTVLTDDPVNINYSSGSYTISTVNVDIGEAFRTGSDEVRVVDPAIGPGDSFYSAWGYCSTLGVFDSLQSFISKGLHCVRILVTSLF